MTDWFAELGKIVLFVLGKYYEFMLFVQTSTAVFVGQAASFLLTGLIFVFFPLVAVVGVLGQASKETYGFYESFWEYTVKALILLVLVFLLLFVFK